MHVDITILTQKHGNITIMYDNVVSIESSNNVTLKLAENYTAKCVYKDWYENNVDLRPYIHTYNEFVKVVVTHY